MIRQLKSHLSFIRLVKIGFRGSQFASLEFTQRLAQVSFFDLFEMALSVRFALAECNFFLL